MSAAAYVSSFCQFYDAIFIVLLKGVERFEYCCVSATLLCLCGVVGRRTHVQAVCRIVYYTLVKIQKLDDMIILPFYNPIICEMVNIIKNESFEPYNLVKVKPFSCASKTANKKYSNRRSNL